MYLAYPVKNYQQRELHCLRKGSKYLIITIVIRKVVSHCGGKKGNTPNRVFIAFDLGETNVHLGGNIGEAGNLKGTEREPYRKRNSNG